MSQKNNTDLMQQLEEYRFSLSQISHEVRNPVTIINSALQLLEKEHPDITQYDLWRDIMDNMHFLRRLLDDLSTYNNTFCCEKRETEMTPWFTNLSRSIPLLFPEKQCKYSVTIPENLPSASIDRLKMSRAMTNLLRNAYEAADSIVSFSVCKQNEALIIEIHNDGAFITSQLKKDIFRPFFTTKTEGTGLGLPIAKRILEAHGGFLSLESSQEQGTTVQIRFPLTTMDR